MNRNIAIALLLVAGALASCESSTSSGPGTAATNGSRVFILDQGLFRSNNASLDQWSWKDSALAKNLVSPLGDVGNDIELINGRLYVVLDNSSKIISINPDSIADRKTINFGAGSTPGKIIQISATEALVADLYGNSASVLDLTTNAVTSTISVGGGQTWLASLGSAVYSVTGANEIVAIDKAAKSMTKHQYIGEIPMQIAADSSRGKLIVFTAGNYSPKTPGKILWVDPSTFAVTDSIVLDTTHYYNQIVMGKNVAYLLADYGVIKIDLISHQIAPSVMIPKNYFGGQYDPIDNLLYLGTAVNFTDPDVVDVYDMSTTTLKKTLNVGIAPAFFAIVR